MNNYWIWTILAVTSTLFGWMNYRGYVMYDSDKGEVKKFKSPFGFKFLEVWRSAVGFFIAGLIAYYFIALRWPLISHGVGWRVSDVILGASFLMGIFGMLPYFARNITQAISAIMAKLLK